MAPSKSNPSQNIHDPDSHTRFDQADKDAHERILELEKISESIRSQMNAIKWLFGICAGLLFMILSGGFGWAWTMQSLVASIQKDVAIQAINSENSKESRNQLAASIKELNTAVQELRLKIRE